MKIPKLEELNKALNGFPEKTIGYNIEYEIIKKLLEISNEIGYGRVHQLVSNIHSIWVDPETMKYYEKSRTTRLKNLEKAIDIVEKSKDED